MQREDCSKKIMVSLPQASMLPCNSTPVGSEPNVAWLQEHGGDGIAAARTIWAGLRATATETDLRRTEEVWMDVYIRETQIRVLLCHLRYPMNVRLEATHR